MTQTTAPARAPERVIPSSALEFVGDSSGALAADMIKSFPNAERIVIEKRSLVRVVVETRYRRTPTSSSATSANSTPAHKPAPVVAAPRPVPVVQVAPPKASISAEAVQRIIKRNVDRKWTVLGIYNPTIIRWGTRPDGTPFGLIEDPSTGIRYAWTVKPVTYDLVDLGAVDL